MPKIREVDADAEVLPRDAKAGAQLRGDPFIALVARLMDEVFTIPGTKIRFGLDPLIGLLPGVGGVASAFVSLGLIALSSRQRVPKIVLVRMALNVLLNAGLEVVPVLGDALSIFFRSNARNYELLRRHAGTARAASPFDWMFVGALIAGVGAVVLAFFAALLYLASKLWTAFG